MILWDLLFYEPWFLGLGVLCTAGALYHHDRTGGSRVGRRGLLAYTAVRRWRLDLRAAWS